MSKALQPGRIGFGLGTSEFRTEGLGFSVYIKESSVLDLWDVDLEYVGLWAFGILDFEFRSLVLSVGPSWRGLS